MIEEQVAERSEQHRHDEYKTDTGDHRRHRKERDPTHGHARRSGREHRDSNRCADSREANCHQAVRSEEKIDHVSVAAKTATVVGKGDDAEDQTSSPHPEAGCGQPWKRDRSSTELHRNNGDAQADGQRQQRPEHEADALSIEKLRRCAVIDVCDTGAVKTDDDVDHDGHEQADETGAEEHSADLLVVGRCQPIGNGCQQLRDGTVAFIGEFFGRCGGGIKGGHTKWSSQFSVQRIKSTGGGGTQRPETTCRGVNLLKSQRDS